MKPIIWKRGDIAKLRRSIKTGFWRERIIASTLKPKVRIPKRKSTPDERQIDYEDRPSK